MPWLSENYKWLFDGVASAAVIAVIGYVVHRFLGFLLYYFPDFPGACVLWT